MFLEALCVSVLFEIFSRNKFDVGLLIAVVTVYKLYLRMILLKYMLLLNPYANTMKELFGH